MIRSLADKVGSFLAVLFFVFGVIIIGIPVLILLVIGIMGIRRCDYDRKTPYYSVAWGQTLAFHNEGDDPLATVKIIETDEYGRKLFTIRKSNSWYDGFVTGCFICQYIEGEKGYCYPDICYELTYDGKISDERMNALKERNDWNRELDREKCKAEEPMPKYNTYHVEDMLYANTDLEEGGISARCLDVDQNGMELHAVHWFSKDGSRSREMYLIVVNSVSRFIAIEKVEDPLNIASDILKIKEETGWIEKYDTTR